MILRERLPRWLRFLIENSLLLLVGAVIALLWINVHAVSYHAFTQPLRFIVNDIGMVFFFAHRREGGVRRDTARRLALDAAAVGAAAARGGGRHGRSRALLYIIIRALAQRP